MTTSLPFVQHIDTKSNIESIVGPIGVMAFASDTLQFGRYNGNEWVWTSPTTLFSNALRTPMGFERTAEGGDPYDCELSYNPATRTVSVYAVSGTFSYWIRGELYTASSIQAVHPDATGMYFFYIDGASQTAVFSTTPWDIFSDVLIAAVYYNADLSDGFAMNERHGAGRDLGSHYADHYKRGAFYVTGQGLEISDYTLQPSSPVDTDNQLSVSSGYIHDEDIRAVITGRSSGSYKIMSRSGASGVWTWENNSVPLLAAAGGYVYYNEWTGATWQQTQVANNKYVNYYVIATPSINSDFDVFMLMGQAEYSSLGDAEAETFADLDFGDVVFQEILSIYKITFRTNSSYVTEGECRIEGVEDTRQTTGRQAVSAPPATNHNSLGGLQGGIAEEYYHLESAEYTALTTGADASTYHVHDGRYYTEAEVDGAITTGVNAGIAALIAGANTWAAKQTFSDDIAVTTNIEVASRVAHIGDDDTYIAFTDNQIELYAGAKRGLTSGASGLTAYIAEYVYHQDDGDTYIQFGPDTIAFVAGATTCVSLGTAGATIYLDQYIYHRGDTDTYVQMTTNNIKLVAGGVTLIDAVEGATDYVAMPRLRISGTNVIDLLPGTASSIDRLDFMSQTANRGAALSLMPNGTSTWSKIALSNQASQTNFSSIFIEVYGSNAYISPQDAGSPSISATTLQFGAGHGVSDYWTTVIIANSEVKLTGVYSDTVGGTNRDLYIDNTGKLGYVSSSQRYKKNISMLTDVNWLYQLRPIEFDYRVDGVHAWGLIAEEVDTIQKMLVSYDDQGRPETVEYSRLVIPLLAAVQELKQRVDALSN